jgi:hypothetical protein
MQTLLSSDITELWLHVSHASIPCGHAYAQFKVRFGQHVLSKTKLWVAESEAYSLVTPGTEFAIPADVVVEAKNRDAGCVSPASVDVWSNEAAELPEAEREVQKESDKKLRWLSKKAVVSIGDGPPAVIAVDGVALTVLDQSNLYQALLIRERVEMRAEILAVQLALIPEVDLDPSQPADIKTAKAGETTSE